MKVLVLGGSGMLGHRVAGVLAQSDHEVTATVRRHDPLLASFVPGIALLEGVTAEDPRSVANAITKTGAEAVVNCIGIVKQKDEAKAEIPSMRVNARFPQDVAKICEILGVRLVHLSTDCVFTGTRGNYTEDDVPDASDIYGRSKLLGEVGGPGVVRVPEGCSTIVGPGTGAVTVRTSMVGWEIHHPTGLLEWFARQRGGACNGYRRGVFSGLSTYELACVIEGLISRLGAVEGLWHVSAEPIDKYDLLVRMRDALGWDIEIVPVDEPAIDRSLDSSAFREMSGWTPPSWDDMVAGLAAERPRYDALAG